LENVQSIVVQLALVVSISDSAKEFREFGDVFLKNDGEVAL